MIARDSRDRLAVALRHYVAGLISNDDVDMIEVDWRDRGAVAVKQMSWGLYSDNKHHFANGEHAINKEGKRVVARWILFLYTDEEYLWPEYSFIQVKNWPMNILTFGWWERSKARVWSEFLEGGDFAVWPFCCSDQLEKAMRRPRLLAGALHKTRSIDSPA